MNDKQMQMITQIAYIDFNNNYDMIDKTIGGILIGGIKLSGVVGLQGCSLIN